MNSHFASIPDIVSQFADNCAGVWLQRERAARSSAYVSTFADVRRLDERIDAQLDGLRVSGKEAARAVTEDLESGGPGELFTSAVLAFENPGEANLAGAVFGELDQEGDRIRPVAVALDWISRERFPAAIDLLSRHGSPDAQAVVLTGWGDRRTKSGSVGRISLTGNSSVIQAAACEAAAHTGDRDLVPQLLELAATTEDPGVRLVSARAALLLRPSDAGASDAPEHLVELASGPATPMAEAAAETLFHYVEPAYAADRHAEMFSAPSPSRAAVKAAGAAGVIELIPFLLRQLDHPLLARLSGQALQAITGIDLKGAGLTRIVPLSEGTGPTDSPDDESTDLDPDEGLLWPNREGVEQWWRQRRTAFVSRARYLWGEIVSEDVLQRCLRDGPQTRRAAAAELAAFRGRPLFDVHAPAFRQMQRLVSGDL